MAYVTDRKNADGEITSYQVKWRLGGTRTAPQQTERFDGDEQGREAAEIFAAAVNEAGQQWPPGWVRGQGYIDPMAGVEDRYRFSTYARESIKNRTGVEERYRQDCLRELETYVFPAFGNCDVRSTEHFSKATISAWVLRTAKIEVWRGSKKKPMSPKTLKNIFGTFSSVLNEAVQEEPPLRDRNPCSHVRLPRTDDGGADDEGDGEDMEFLTPDEVTGIVECLPRPEDKRLVLVAYGTGMRWGEITALAKKHSRTPAAGEFALRVARAWKRSPEKGFYLGTPKTKASRRTVKVSAGVWAVLLDGGLAGMASNDLIFHNGHGERLVYSTFYDRWVAAVAEAKGRGLLPDWKVPTFHDLRHSHVAALLSDRHSLTYVQRRLGHESIKTTSDKYGHLLEEAHQGALATIDRALGIEVAPAVDAAEEEHEARTPVKDPGRSLYVAHVGTVRLPFWDDQHAEETAERWARERGGQVRVEKMTADWWVRSTSGRVGGDNGLKGVRREMPSRAFIWRVGPAVYAADGTELVLDPGVHEACGGWVWDFEPEFTDEPAHHVAEWRRGPAAETEAWAWGPDRQAVISAYATARSDALRVCGLHPDRTASDREPAT